MARTADERAYHARKERQYRSRRSRERDTAIAQLAAAASVLLGGPERTRMTVGQIVDIILEARP
jgi:hypothetical protein